VDVVFQGEDCFPPAANVGAMGLRRMLKGE
jgi:hypothetical protein